MATEFDYLRRPGPDAPLIPREILFGNPHNSGPQVSPDGRLLAYLAPDDSGVLNVWVRDLETGDEKVVTSDEKRGIRLFSWQWDSQCFLYIQDRDGDENWHLFQTRIKDRETRNLTPFPGVQALLVAYEPSYPETLLVALNKRDARCHDVYQLQLSTGELQRIADNPGDVISWTADHELKVRACAAMSEDGGTIIRVRSSPDSPWREFQHWGPDETFGGIAGFTPDNDSLWLLSSIDANAARLLEARLDDGTCRVLAEDSRFDVTGVMTHPTGHFLEAVEFVRQKREYLITSPSLQDGFDRLQAKDPDAEVSILSRSLDDSQWVISYTSDSRPVRYYSYSPQSQELDYLFSSRPDLEDFELCPMRPISFAARDGMQIHGYLTVPLADPAQLPLVLLVHGGPWARDTWGFESEVQWLANRGYIVLQVNFRGSSGYGKQYMNAGNREWAAGMQNDLIDAKNWALAQGYGDPSRVGIMGGSYGGYAVLVGLAFTPEEFACGVDIVGPSNLATLIESIPPYWVPMKSVFDRRVGNLETEKEFLDSRSPLYRADQIQRPLLIAQGANDPRVKQTESDQIVRAMRSNGQSVLYIVFEDEGHGFARPLNRLRFYAAAEQFLATHLSGRHEPPSREEDWRDLEN